MILGIFAALLLWGPVKRWVEIHWALPPSGTDSYNWVHLWICVLPISPREVKEPYNRFICTINKSFSGLKRQKEQKHPRKRPLIRWSMRCFYLTSKASWGVQPEFWLSPRSFTGWSEARDVPQFLLESFPCCFQQKGQTILLSPSLAQHVNGHFFPPILRISPSFPRSSQLSFLLVALFCTQWPLVFMWKKMGSFAPFLFVETCVLGISMVTHIRGQANPAFRLCSSWHHVFVLLLSDVERLWLDHATTNLIREANRVSVCMSSISLGIWITQKERFTHKSVRTAINNYEKITSLTLFCRDTCLWRCYSFLLIACWQ